MNVRRYHKIFGIILLLPFLCWAVTGFIFFIKPGYSDAYDYLTPKTYPLNPSVIIHPDSSWRNIQYFKTVLGDHLIVTTDTGMVHLDPVQRQLRSRPSDDDIIRLAHDAFSHNPERYGHVIKISGDTLWTDTGVEVTVDWSTLSFQQRGKDTDRIDLLYKIHYLQWTGIKTLDQIIGVLGLVLLLALTILGARLAFKGGGK